MHARTLCIYKSRISRFRPHCSPVVRMPYTMMTSLKYASGVSAGAQLATPGSQRKLSGTSVASFGSFASSYQDYCRKLSNSSVSSGLAGSNMALTHFDGNDPLSPPPTTCFNHPLMMTAAAQTGTDQRQGGGGTADSRSTSTVPRKFSDPHEYRRVARVCGGGHATGSGSGGKMAPLMFEVDRTGGLRRLTSASLEHYRPYMSR